MTLSVIIKTTVEQVKKSGYSINMDFSMRTVLIYPDKITCCYCDFIYNYPNNNSPLQCPVCERWQTEDHSIFLQGDDAENFLNLVSNTWHHKVDDCTMQEIGLHQASSYIDCL